MPDREVDHLLIGGGIASAQCAAELRRRGADGSILLVGREQDPPYDRPPLSKDYLRGESERSDAYVHPPEWYDENSVELLTGKSVMSLDAEAKVAKLQGGEEVGFGSALLATGAMVNILRVDGAHLEGIHYLRAFGNADAIRKDVADAEHVVLVGASYIGAEVAASLVEMGKRCTLVAIEPVALSRGLGEEVGRYFHDLLESKGIEIHGEESLAGFGGEERVTSVRTESGREIQCDAVVVGAGVRPDTMLAGARGPRGGRRDRLRLSAADIGGGDLRRGRLLQLRERAPRASDADRALGRRLSAGSPRRSRDARRPRPLSGRSLFLQRPLRLGRDRIRRAGGGVGRSDLARRP